MCPNKKDLTEMRLIYLTGPYSDPETEVREQRVRVYQEALSFFSNTAKNLCMYSPIVHWHGVPRSFEFAHAFDYWLQQDFHMIRLSTAIWVMALPGWQKSYELSQELDYAQDLGKSILYVIKEENNFHLTDNIPSPSQTITI